MNRPSQVWGSDRQNCMTRRAKRIVRSLSSSAISFTTRLGCRRHAVGFLAAISNGDYSLDAGNVKPYPTPHTFTGRRDMTILVGFACQDGLIIGADSEENRGVVKVSV